ncbi:hypothetical protein [Nocardia sp. alder85J]|nr:hypothetical protein [Nocardia sp. alder85J]MCX4096160.1 hypothetical protein [Nocardia sp. alder85J]
MPAGKPTLGEQFDITAFVVVVLGGFSRPIRAPGNILENAAAAC